MKKLRQLSVLLLAFLFVFTATPAINVSADTNGAATYYQDMARSVFPLINSFRKSSDAWYWNSNNTEKVYCNGLRSLQYDANLERVAKLRALEITTNFSHTRPNGTRCFTAFDELGVNASAYGENIARGYTSASAVHNAFREDNEKYDGQGHRRIMLGYEYNAVGIACVELNGKKYWVEEFGYLDNITPVSGTTTTAYTGLKNINGTWYYVQNNAINYGYTGLCLYNNNWYYVQNGKLNWNYTGLCKHNGNWYYVYKGVLNWNYTGLCKHNGTWYYVQKGVLNWNYTGLCKYNGTWYYVQKGVLNWNYTGLCKHNGTWYYVQKGVLNWNYTGLCKYNNNWWFVQGGVVNFKTNSVEQNQYGWWYIKNSMVDFSYNGVASNKYGTWLIQNGKVNFNYNGEYKAPDGKVYNIKNGKVV